MQFFKKTLQILLTSLAFILRWISQNRSVMIFLVFLVLASGFWFLNALRKSYVATISFPVHLVNLPSQSIFVGNQNSSILNIKVRASGFSLLRYNMGPHAWTLGLDVSKMKRYYKSDSRGVFVITRDIESAISTQLSNELELLSISPDTLFIPFFNKAQKKVPVQLNASLSFTHPYYQSASVILQPDSIEITGPDLIIDTINSVSTQYRQFNNLNQVFVGTLSLQTNPSIGMSASSVMVKIPCEAFTESSVNVPIHIKGAPEGLIVKTFPADVKISFRVGLSRYESVRGNFFSAVVDVTGIDFNKQKRLKVKLDKTPDFVYAIEYKPLFVDYLIERTK
jgi:hypothetical protein